VVFGREAEIVHVVVEGTHGVGKTTAIGLVVNQALVPELVGLPSFVVDYEILLKLPGAPQRMFRINDIAKSQAQVLAGPSPTIADRAYSSTLAFAIASARRGTLPVSFLSETRAWVEDGLERGLLLRPDRLVVLDLDGELAWQRVCYRGAHDWTSPEEILRLADVYRDPPDWYTNLVAGDYKVVASGTIKENVSTLVGMFA
jgi:thymidylate kinase